MSGEDQGDERKRTIDEMRCRNIIDGVKIGVLACPQDKLRGNLVTAWAASGIKMA